MHGVRVVDKGGGKQEDARPEALRRTVLETRHPRHRMNKADLPLESDDTREGAAAPPRAERPWRQCLLALVLLVATLVVFAPTSLANGAPFNDTATVSAQTFDPNSGNNTATVTGSVVNNNTSSNADLSVAVSGPASGTEGGKAAGRANRSYMFASNTDISLLRTRGKDRSTTRDDDVQHISFS